MSLITSVIVSVFAIDPAKEETMIESIQRYIVNHGHQPFERIEGGGGEKRLTCELLIGSFDCFDTWAFKDWLAGHPFFDQTSEHVQIELIVQEVDREDFAKWKVLELRKPGLSEVEAEREACAADCDEEEKYCRQMGGKMTGHAAAYHHAAAKTAGHLARKIRARSTPKIAPHAFKGRTDRCCEVCNRRDRDPIHAGQNASISEIDRKIEIS